MGLHENEKLQSIWELSKKLEHKLTSVRDRTVARILFKFQAELIRTEDLPHGEETQRFVQRILAYLLDSEIQSSVVQLMGILIESQFVLEILRHEETTTKIFKKGLLQGDQDVKKCCQKILSLMTVDNTDKSPKTHKDDDFAMNHKEYPQVPPSTKPDNKEAPMKEEKQVNAYDLELSGWRFPFVELVASDDQFIFEFEARCKLRTTFKDIISLSDQFRLSILRDFPPEIFLQRPAVLCHLISLVKMPLNINHTEEMDFSDRQNFGLSFFRHEKALNEESSTVIASLLVLEALFRCLGQSALQICNSSLWSFSSSTQDDIFATSSTNLHRKTYPNLRENEDLAYINPGPGFSLSGAAYKVFVTFVPLLLSRFHPKLHILHLLRIITPFLRERGVTDDRCYLDKERLQNILNFLGEVTGYLIQAEEIQDPVPSFHGNTQLRALKTNIHISMVQLLHNLFVQYRGMNFSIESQQKASDEIEIPRRLWDYMEQHVLDEQFYQAYTESTCSLQDIRSVMTEIDSKPKSDLKTVQEVITDIQMLRHFFGSSKEQSNVDTTGITSDMLLRAIYAIGAHVDPIVDDNQIIHGVLKRLTYASSRSNCESEVAQMREGIVVFLSQNFEWQLLSPFIDGIAAIITSSTTDAHFIEGVFIEPKILSSLLLSMASNNRLLESTSVWKVVEVIIFAVSRMEKVKLMCFADILPLIQHFAYLDLTKDSGFRSNKIRKKLIEVLNLLERISTDSQKLLMMSRCLLHNSEYIKKSAMTGLVHFLLNKGREMPQLSISNLEGSKKGQNSDVAFITHIDQVVQFLLQHPLSHIDSVAEMMDTSSVSIASIKNLRRSLETCTLDPRLLSSVCKELLMLSENLSLSGINSLVGVGEAQRLSHVIVTVILSNAGDDFTSLALLETLRKLVFKSLSFREAIRQDAEILCFLVAETLNKNTLISGTCLCILVSLAYSLELFALDLKFDKELVVRSSLSLPSFIIHSLASSASQWVSAGFPLATYSMSTSLNERRAQLWPPDLISLCSSNGQRTFKADFSLDLSFPIEIVKNAHSSKEFLWGAYLLVLQLQNSPKTRQTVANDWETIFGRFLEVLPESQRDLTIFSSVLTIIEKVILDMSRDQYLSLVILTRNILVPLLRRPCKKFSTKVTVEQVLHVVLQLSRSIHSDIFITLVSDTDVVKIICAQFLSVYSSCTSLYSLSLRCVQQMIRLSSGGQKIISHSVWREHFPVIISNCMKWMGKRSSPGSFLNSDTSRIASEVMYIILSIAPETFTSPECYKNWYIQLVLDTSCSIRVTGFSIASALFSVYGMEQTTERMIEMALDSSFDPTQSDAIRSSSLEYILEVMKRSIGRSSHVQYFNLLSRSIGKKGLVKSLIKSLACVSDGNHFLILYQRSLIRVLHYVLIRETELGDFLGKVSLEFLESNDYGTAFMELGQMLSIPRQRKCYENSITNKMKYNITVDLCTQLVWNDAILPSVFDLINDGVAFIRSVLELNPESEIVIIQQSLLLNNLIDTLIICGLMHPDLVINQYQAITSICDLLEEITVRFELTNKMGSVVSSIGHPRNVLNGLISSKWQELFRSITALTSHNHPDECRTSACKLITSLCSAVYGSPIPEEDATVINSQLYALFKEKVEERLETLLVKDCSQQTYDLTAIQLILEAMSCVFERSSQSQTRIIRLNAWKFSMNVLNQLITFIQLNGGYSSIRTKHLSKEPHRNSSKEAVALASRIIMIMLNFLGSIIFKNIQVQDCVRNDEMVLFLNKNFDILKSAEYTSVPLLGCAQRVLANYLYNNWKSKASLAFDTDKTTPDRNVHLLVQLFDMILETSPTSSLTPGYEQLHHLIVQVLNSSMLSSECVQVAVKKGFVGHVVRRITEASPRKTNRDHAHIEAYVGSLLTVLSSAACVEEGQRAILASKGLKDLFDDVLHSGRISILEKGALLIRNLSFFDSSKHAFLVWEQYITSIVDHLHKSNLNVCLHLSCALWSIIYDNQRAATVVKKSFGFDVFHRLAYAQKPESSNHPLVVKEFMHNLLQIARLLNDEDVN